ncbi:recombination regulator RecX [Ligilactobacillus saerimneri]|uniref:recombination regulator RecX n=1 Tax=Ligilactobacillus saerimneri TaxID=228229 RepID=UPI002941E890|nr:recombination regulator RecX [Ligilactobacillus saerimneri]
MFKKITMIKTQKRPGRYNIYLDGKYAFALNEDVLIQFHLTKGMELDEEAIVQLKQADQVAQAKSRAIDYLSRQLRSEREVRIFLQTFELKDTDEQAIIAKLKELNLLNDLNYAQSYVRTQARLSDKGPKYLQQKLLQKGIAPALITQALMEFAPANQIVNGSKLAKKLARRYQKDPFRVQMQKIKRGLYQKGYDNDIISTVIDQLNLTQDDDAEYEHLVAYVGKQQNKLARLAPTDRAFKLKQLLYRHGFARDAIDRFFAENNDY